MQSIKCIGFGQNLKRCDGLKNFSVSKSRWSLQLGSLGIKSNVGKQRRWPWSLNCSQGMLNGQPDKAQCGIHWLCRQSPSLLPCSRVTHLLNLLKLYHHNQADKLGINHTQCDQLVISSQ